jgi:putative two-component system response regulator
MPPQILIVDDDPQIVTMLSRLLSRDGYLVATATNGREALAAVYSLMPDLILLDVGIPEIDGFAVCERVKNDERTALIPVTMLTGRDDDESHRRGIEAGADDFLAKPFEHSILRARIRSQLRIKRLTDQLETTERVIFTLANVVEQKDAYTEGHLRRLQAYSGKLAQAAGLDDSLVNAIRYGGILHDIGKIGISESILAKPGPLTDEEMHAMRQHVVIGERLIAEMRFARDIAPIIRGHHERWDGTGYPDRLHGSAIPIGARIVAIVDAYDAMVTDRPYRAALPQAEAIDRLRAGSGTQFDPDLLAIFIQMLEQHNGTPAAGIALTTPL